MSRPTATPHSRVRRVARWIGGAALVAVWLVAGGQPGQAQTALDAAPILTVVGAAESGDSVAATFDRADLDALPVHTIETTTPWTDGVVRFEGPLARDVLSEAGVAVSTAGETLATAINDYQVAIPVSDFYDYDVILALRQDGRALSRRDKGPIWIVYPRHRHPELDSVEYHSRWVWQLTTLELE